MLDFIEAIRDFTETGGQVLLVIGILIFVMWLLILERSLYLTIWHKKYREEVIKRWNQRADHSSWNAHQIRTAMVSRVSMALSGQPSCDTGVGCSVSPTGPYGHSHRDD